MRISVQAAAKTEVERVKNGLTRDRATPRRTTDPFGGLLDPALHDGDVVFGEPLRSLIDAS